MSSHIGEATATGRASRSTAVAESHGADADGGEGIAGRVADGVDEAVSERPEIELLTRLGWIAKGVVYFLMGATAISIAQQEVTDDEASPTGALNRVMEQPGGRVLLGVLAVGLVLYSAWRILSVAVIRSNGLTAWLDRIGYTFSAGFYGLLAYVAARTVLRGSEQPRDNTVERLSRTLMESGTGRVLVAVGGLITIAVGLYFVVRKGIMRSFVDDLRDVHGDADRDGVVDHVLIVSGVIGWIGRGVVTILVGFFVTRAAIRFDPDDARGFDGALRKVATTTTGTWLVWACAVGLILYGGFCLLSHRRRELKDHSS